MAHIVDEFDVIDLPDIYGLDRVSEYVSVCHSLCSISVLERSCEYFCLYNSWATLAAEVHVGGSFFGEGEKKRRGRGRFVSAAWPAETCRCELNY